MIMDRSTRRSSALQPGTLPSPRGRERASPVGHVAEALEWEELPSLSHILAHYRQHGTVARTVAVWHPTQPQALPPGTEAPQAFDEPIAGLQTRELDGTDLFDHFFGSGQP